MGHWLIKVLIALPLLVPQGMCICDSLTPCQACAEPAPAVAEACPCCAHEAEPVDDEVVLAPFHTCDPQPGDPHVPCCPAQGHGQWKADLKAPAPTLPLAWAMLSSPLAEADPGSSQAAPLAHLRTEERPIYLTLLTLRI